MKAFRILIPLLFLGFLLSSASVEVKILGKWVMVKMVIGGESKKSPTGEESAYMDFKEDGKVEFGNGTKQPKPGEWAYDKENKILYLYEKADQTDPMIIKKLSKKKLILTLVREKISIHLTRAD
ncbi:MAG: hypothetical protein ACI837_003183 [Crocinitomicaceae bacterium]|jgi:hypothetical protein